MFIVTVTGASGTIWNGLLANRATIEAEIRTLFSQQSPSPLERGEFQFQFIAMNQKTTEGLTSRDMHATVVVHSLTPHTVWADQLRDRLLPFWRGIPFSVTMLGKYEGKPLYGHAVHHPGCLND